MIAYRPATPADADAIARLHAQSWRESYRGSFRDEFLDGDLVGERLGVWRERLERPPAEQLVLLAEDGGALAGFVCAYGAHDPKWGSLVDNLHVATPQKGRGIGAALLRRAGAWLAERHPDRGVYLLVLEANAPARRFYERLGGRNAETFRNETHGGAIVQSCRYTWARPELLRLDLALGVSGREANPSPARSRSRS
jgi:ribosomal protein S18 acetylase RimI-like enzyme